MKKLIYTGTLWLLALLLAGGCSSEEPAGGETAGGEDGLVPVAFRLQPEALQMVVSTEDTGGKARLVTRAESGDATINNLTVLQFNWDKNADGGDGSTAVCITSRYLRAPEPEEGTGNVYSIGLRAVDKQSQYLIFIANAGSVFQQYEGKTLADFRNETVELNQKTTDGDNVLMIGAVHKAVTSTVNIGSPYDLTLLRLVARIHFTWEARPTVTNTTFTPSVLQLKNVPKVLKYIDGAETAPTDYPAKVADNFKDYTAIVDRIDEGFTWYIPLNRRSSTGSGKTAWEKTGENAPDDYCTYIELAGVYTTPNMPDQLATYRFYIGKNLTNDYNINQNHAYEVNAVITGVNTFDKRVTRKNFSYYQSANCFLIAPEKDNELSFSPYDAPGVDVAGTNVTFHDLLIEDRYSRIADVKLIWQTSNDLVTVSHGQGMISVKPNESGTSGNALIGAYDDAGKMLWSWHIWVTDYVDIVINNLIDPLMGSIQTYNNETWMDRNLGALDIQTPAVAELMYQWGRKDPFLDNYYTQDPAPVDALIASIMNPNVFYKVKTGNTWYGDIGQAEYLWQDNVKTIFDPCPYGWRIPPKGSWSSFNSNNFSTWYSGRYSDYKINDTEKAIYRLSGRKRYDTGISESLREEGFLWSSSSGSSKDAYHLYYKSLPTSGSSAKGIIIPDNLSLQAYGFPVRCIKIK